MDNSGYTLNALEAFLSRNLHVKITAISNGYRLSIADVYQYDYPTLCKAFHAAQLLA